MDEVKATETTDQVIVSEEAAWINELADAAKEVPNLKLYRSAQNANEVFSLDILRSLAAARKAHINIGDLLINTVAKLRQEAGLDDGRTSD